MSILITHLKLLAAEFATHKEIFDAKDTEIGRQKQKTKRAEAILVEVLNHIILLQCKAYYIKC